MAEIIDLVPGTDAAPNLPSRLVTVNLAGPTEGPLVQGDRAVTFRLVGDIHAARDRVIVGSGHTVTAHSGDRLRLPCHDGTTGEWAIEVKKSWTPYPYLIRIPAGSTVLDLSQINALRPAQVAHAGFALTNASAEWVDGAERGVTVTVTGGIAHFRFVSPPSVPPTAVSLETSDLDTITTPGDYWQSTASNATLDRHYPRDGMTMTLRVDQAASSIVTQEAVHYAASGVVGVYRRTIGPNGATPWVPAASTAVQLSTRDLDDVRTPGTYWQSIASNATLARHYPRAGMTIALTVTPISASGVLQEAVHYDSSGVRGRYSRTVLPTVTTPWVPGADTPLSLETSDLDTITTPGDYWQSNPANATAAKNYPRDAMLGTLTVSQAASGIWLQTFTHYDSTGVQGVYHRTVTASSATPWTMVAGTPSSPGTPPPPAAARAASRKRAGGVILRFDDGYTSVLQAAEYMSERGMHGYLAACPGIPGAEYMTGTIMDADGLRSLHYTHGWEIGNHTSTHVTVTAPDFLQRVDEASKMLQDIGVGYPTTFTYPTGARTAAMDKELARRFNQVQLTTEATSSAVRADTPVFFTGWTVVSGTATADKKAQQIARAKRYVQASITAGLVPTLAFHGIAAPGAVPRHEGELDWATFTQLIDWLAAEGYETISPRDLKPFNLIVDPGFNAYPVLGFAAAAYPWAAAAATGVWTRATTGQHTGHACIVVDSTSAVTGTVSQGIAIGAGRYRLNVLANLERVTGGHIEIEIRPRTLWGDTVGETIVPLTLATTSSGYQPHAAEFTIPDGVLNASVFIRAAAFTGRAAVDHIAITPSTLPDLYA